MRASPLNPLGGLILVMGSLASRIKEVMGDMTPSDFAAACGVSPASVTFWLNGDTKALKAEPVANMEARFGYRASWIVTGKGPKKIADKPDASWRFSDDLSQKVLLLQDEELLQAENVLRAHLKLPQKQASSFTNKGQFPYRVETPPPYAHQSEDGIGIPTEMQPMSNKQHGSGQKHRRPTRQKGGGSS